MKQRDMESILVVDDSLPFRNAVGALLKDIGYEDIILLESAEKALSCLLIEGSDIDVILMDLNMPKMDGIEAVKRIKRYSELQDIPVVIVSVQDEEEKIEKAFQAGAIDFVSKPIKKMELRARLGSILKLKKEMDERKQHELELEKTVYELEKALTDIKTLSGLLPICSNCKKVRDDKGYWTQVEKFLSTRSGIQFSHSICPDCAKELYPEIADKIDMQNNKTGE